MINDPVFENGNSNYCFTCDIGLMLSLSDSLSFGLCWKNVNRPELGLSSNSRVPSICRLGLSFKNDNFILAIDRAYRNNRHYGYLGVEWNMNDYFTLRAGINHLDYSFGFGFDLKKVIVDYAFTLPLTSIKDTFGSHRLSLDLVFPKLQHEKEIL